MGGVISVPAIGALQAHLPAPRLLVIDVVDAYGLVILHTIWAMTADLRCGRRETRSETLASPAILLARLSELVPMLFITRRPRSKPPRDRRRHRGRARPGLPR